MGISTAMQAIRAFARDALARYRQRQLATAARHALDKLDDRALHDIGFDRSEITSVAAELSGQAEHTRVRLLSPQISFVQ